MDIVDQAQAYEEQHRQDSLQRQLSEAQRTLEPADNCIDCGTMIPSMRQAAVPGTQYCVGCADRHERAHSQRRSVFS